MNSSNDILQRIGADVSNMSNQPLSVQKDIALDLQQAYADAALAYSQAVYDVEDEMDGVKDGNTETPADNTANTAQTEQQEGGNGTTDTDVADAGQVDTSTNVPSNVNRNLDIEKFTVSNGIIKDVAVKDGVVVDISKIEVFARGKSIVFDETLAAEMRELKRYKNNNRKEYDADPANEVRLLKLGRLEYNYNRSQGMARALEKAGLPDTVESNYFIINHFLDVGKIITSENRVRYKSILSGPSGDVRVESTFIILDDGRKLLTTIHVVPKFKM